MDTHQNDASRNGTHPSQTSPETSRGCCGSNDSHAYQSSTARTYHELDTHSCGSSRSRSLRRVGLALCLVLAVGMLIWFKLRVVTGVPRQAYADPESKQAGQQKRQPGSGASDQTTLPPSPDQP
jgi:hypothetical protein